ncbi:MAG: hypothetical protein HOQ22_00480, partial [Nocardioidaceae bacterium]|nr:hypothetical protein [Nocardioidaceae bacterium]
TAVAAQRSADGDLADDFAKVDRNTTWTQVSATHLDFQTFHTEALAVTPDHVFLSAVEIIEPTQKYPSPVGGHDRTPGKGVGHLFVMDRQGHLQKDIVLGEGDMYHPGGIDYDGRNIWVPVAQYRPNSSAIIYRVDATSLRVHEQLRVPDHVGGIVLDKTTNRLVGNTWGSRRFYEWTLGGTQTDTWLNADHYVDAQDCQYVDAGKMLCGGVTNLPQTASAGGSSAVYELGGLALTDLHSHRILHEVPFQRWSEAGHVMTRNPVKLAAHDGTIDLWAAPDNGEEAGGTELYHLRADVG